MQSSDRISPKQARLIGLLLTERTAEDACRKANVSVTTYWRWMRETDFQIAYRDTRKDILENTVAKLQGIAFAAVDTLERNLNCENPSAEIRAASIILEQAAKGVEVLDLAVRLEFLEEYVKGLEGADE